MFLSVYCPKPIPKSKKEKRGYLPRVHFKVFRVQEDVGLGPRLAIVGDIPVSEPLYQVNIDEIALVPVTLKVVQPLNVRFGEPRNESAIDRAVLGRGDARVVGVPDAPSLVTGELGRPESMTFTDILGGVWGSVADVEEDFLEHLCGGGWLVASCLGSRGHDSQAAIPVYLSYEIG